jgi:hypothetical protein
MFSWPPTARQDVPIPLIGGCGGCLPLCIGRTVYDTSPIFWDAQETRLPGCGAPLAGRDDEVRRLRTSLAPAADSPRNRVVIVEGPGGSGRLGSLSRQDARLRP